MLTNKKLGFFHYIILRKVFCFITLLLYAIVFPFSVTESQKQRKFSLFFKLQK